MLSLKQYSLNCGWEEDYNTLISKSLEKNELIWYSLPHNTTDYLIKAEEASKYWILKIEGVDTLIFSFKGEIYNMLKEGTKINSWKKYNENGRKILPIVNKVHELL